MAKVSTYFDILKDENGEEFMAVEMDGIALLRLPMINKGTAFTEEERIALRLDGLLPPEVNTLETQVDRVYRAYQAQATDIDKYQFLRALQERHEILFYALLERHVTEMLPIIYTPTVGEAVRRFSNLYQTPRGLSLSTRNIQRAKTALANYPWEDVRMIVATDSSAILGIGDQGYGGLAISIGKLALYTVAGGVGPIHTMPVSLDVGTERKDLVDDPLYLGVRHARLRGDQYMDFMDAFVEAVAERFPQAILQWEDLSKDTAFGVLERYRKRLPSFNDDIQGTGAVTLAGVLSACRTKGERLRDQRIVIHGAGAGGAGVAWALREGMIRDGLTFEQANAQIFVLDSKGLLVKDRQMEAYKKTFCHDKKALAGWSYTGDAPQLLETIAGGKATVLIGLSGQPGTFDEQVIGAVAKNTERPIVFALSNPTSSCEAHPQDVARWTEGRAIVATGSPFAEVEWKGEHIPVGQGNNAFIFPGLGQGAILSGATEITDGMVLESAYALAAYTEKHHPTRVYPPVEEMRDVAIRVAAAVMRRACSDGVASVPVSDVPDLEGYVAQRFWKPRHLPVRRAAR